MDKASIASISVSPEETVKEAIVQFNETGKKILFVVSEDHTLTGVVTDGDIRHGMMKGVQYADPISRVMNTDYLFLAQGTPMLMEECRRIMIETTVEYIPILDENRRIVDILRWTDAFGAPYRKQSSEIMPNKVVIMAGGKGTRLEPFTKIFPKPLIPVGNKPVIEVIMEKFHTAGFANFIYTLNYRKEYIIAFLRENTFPFSCSWVEEPEYLGTAGSLRLMHDKLDDTFFVSNCDTILDINFAKVLQWHKQQGAALTIIGCYNEVKIPFGVLKTSDGILEDMEEKPARGFVVNTGVYVLEPRVISYLPTEGPCDMNELIALVSAREKVCVHTTYAGWYDIGQLEQYRRVIDKLSSIT